MNPLVGEAIHGLRSAWRRGNRVITAMILLILALGIGAATAVFSVVDAFLIRQLPFPEAKELVNVELTTSQGQRTLFGETATVALYEAWKRDGDIQIAGFQEGSAILTGDLPARTIQAVGVTKDLIPLLGVRPDHGRDFVDSDDAHRSAPSAILSHGLAVQLFGTAGSAVGRHLTINGVDVLAIGTMPRGFRVPLSIDEGTQHEAELWLPFNAYRDLFSMSEDSSTPIEIIGRVKKSNSIGSIEGRLSAIAKEVMGTNSRRTARGRHPADTAQISSLRDVVARSVRTPLLLISGAVALLLILACLNTGNLLLVRTISRERELAVRSALGASNMRLVRQLIGEGVALSLLGGLLGIGLAFLALPAIVTLGASYLPDVDAISLDFRGASFGLLVAAMIGLAISGWPVLTGSHRSPVEVMASRSPASRRSTRRIMWVLAAAEVALAIIGLSTTGMLVRSFARLVHSPRGYDTRRVVLASLVLPRRLYPTSEGRRAFELRFLHELRLDSSIASAALSSGAPILGGETGNAWDGSKPVTAKGFRTSEWSVLGDYFGTFNIPIVRGRQPDFNPDSDEIAIDRPAARTIFGTEDVVGRRVRWGFDKTEGIVVALVGDVQEFYMNLAGDSRSRYRSVRPHIYVPVGKNAPGVLRVAVVTKADTARAIQAIREALARIDPGVPVDSANSIEQLITDQLEPERFLMVIFSLSAIIAVAISGSGIFAVMAYSTTQRTHEIGVRLALGASPSGIALLVLRSAFVVTAAGVGCGLFGVFALRGLLASFLFETSPSDARTIVAVVISATIISLLASTLPALRAAGVKATVALLNQG